MYSPSEFDVMCSDLEHTAGLGAAGVVCGVLHEDKTVDLERTSQLVELAGTLEVTFHRAFDETPNLYDALENIIACGCNRVLSSGAKPSAGDGESILAALVEQARGRLRIAAGGGITVTTAARLLARTDVDLHASLRRRFTADPSNDSRSLVSGADLDLNAQTANVRALAHVISTAPARRVGSSKTQ